MLDARFAPTPATRRWLAAAALCAAVSACGTTEPADSLPDGSVPVAAPAIYREWFARTEACAGISGSMTRIQFLVVPGVETFETGQGAKVGLWVRRGDRHYIVIAGNYQQHEMVVRHEMLHSLIGRQGHPGDLFSDRCRLTWETWSAA